MSHPAAPHELRAEGLECLRGEVLLFQNLNLRLLAGEVMQVDGPNGAGKTSLLRMLAGLTLPEAGHVYWNGQRARGGDFQQALNYVGHAHGIKSGLSVLENLRFYRAFRGGGAEPAAVAERMGLSRQLDRLGHTLSAGQRRRAALARLLLRPVPLWILDEPYTALDAEGVALVDALIHEHCRSGGLVVLTSHQRVELADLPVQRLRLGA